MALKIENKKIMKSFFHFSNNHVPPHVIDPVVSDTLEQSSSSFTKKERQSFLAQLPDIIRLKTTLFALKMINCSKNI